mgnify:CR=1 FL=1
MQIIDLTVHQVEYRACFCIIIMDKMGKDNFVPICTKNVFLKYYTGEVTQFYVWDENDRRCYFEKMCSSIYEYLTGRRANQESVASQEEI